MVVTGANAGLSCLFLSQSCGTEGSRRTRAVLVAEIRGGFWGSTILRLQGGMLMDVCGIGFAAPPSPRGAFLGTVCVWEGKDPLGSVPLK